MYFEYLNQRPGEAPQSRPEDDVQIIDVADYQPRHVPSKTCLPRHRQEWRECIKKIYEASPLRACPEFAEGARARRVDPLCCPNCGGEMRSISFITDPPVIRKILKHLDLGKHKPSKDSPNQEPLEKPS